MKSQKSARGSAFLTVRLRKVTQGVSGITRNTQSDDTGWGAQSRPFSYSLGNKIMYIGTCGNT